MKLLQGVINLILAVVFSILIPLIVIPAIVLGIIMYPFSFISNRQDL